MTNSQPDYERWAELEEQLAEAKRLLEVKLGNTIYRKLANLEEELNRLRAIPLAPEPDLYDPGWKTWRECVQHYETHLHPSLLEVTGKSQIQSSEDARREANLQMRIEDPDFKE